MSSAHTIFVVDDDAAVTRALARLLRADGWRVKTFGSAEAFLAARDAEVSGCLVLDVNLPGLDGLALQQQLRDTGEDAADRVPHRSRRHSDVGARDQSRRRRFPHQAGRRRCADAARSAPRSSSTPRSSGRRVDNAAIRATTETR